MMSSLAKIVVLTDHWWRWEKIVEHMCFVTHMICLNGLSSAVSYCFQLLWGRPNTSLKFLGHVNVERSATLIFFCPPKPPRFCPILPPTQKLLAPPMTMTDRNLQDPNRPTPHFNADKSMMMRSRRRCRIALASIRRMEPNDGPASRTEFGPYTTAGEVAAFVDQTVVPPRKTKAANLCKWVHVRSESDVQNEFTILEWNDSGLYWYSINTPNANQFNHCGL